MIDDDLLPELIAPPPQPEEPNLSLQIKDPDFPSDDESDEDIQEESRINQKFNFKNKRFKKKKKRLLPNQKREQLFQEKKYLIQHLKLRKLKKKRSRERKYKLVMKEENN